MIIGVGIDQFYVDVWVGIGVPRALGVRVGKSAKISLLETTKPTTEGYSHEAIVWAGGRSSRVVKCVDDNRGKHNLKYKGIGKLERASE